MYLCFAQPSAAQGGGPFSVVQHKVGDSTSSAITVAVTVAATGSGNLIVVGTGNSGTRTVTGVSDTKCPAYVEAPNAHAVNGTRETDLWYCAASVSGATTVTVTFSGAAGTFDKVATVWEVSGFTNVQLDMANAATGTASSSIPGAQVTTHSSAEFLAGEVYSQQGIQTDPLSGNAFTSGGNIGSQGNGAGCSLISSSVSAYAPAWGYSSGTSVFAASTAAWVNGQTSVAPAINSASSTAFTVGVPGTFTVVATGAPTPTLSESGALPAGVTFTAATGVLNGTPAAGTAGSYPIALTAQNGIGANATQNFMLTVNPAILASIAVTPANPSIAKGTTQQFTATGTYTDGTTQNLTGTATWNSSATTVAAVTTTGLATAVAIGSTTIRATSGAISGTTTLTVTAATLASIAVTPTNPSIAKGTTQQFTAAGTYSDNSTQNLTGTATWSSSTTAISTITTAGLGNALAIGSTTIKATSGAISGTTALTVTAATLVSIAVTPANPSIGNGASQQFTATGTYTDGTTQNLTGTATWSSLTTTVATITTAGLASAVAAGSATIQATLGSITGSTGLTVTPPPLVSIAVTPANPSIAKGTTQQFTATGTYSDSSTQNLSGSAKWVSTTTTTASIAAGGLASGVATGNTTIQATSGSITGSTSLTVTAATLVSITVTPVNPSIANGATELFTATGTYTDGTTQNLSSTATWSSSATTVAKIGATGLATASSAGSTTIQATSGSISGTTTLTVTGGDPVALVQHVAGDSTSSAVTVAVTLTATGSGNLIVVGTGNSGTRTVTGVSDAKCASYVEAPNAHAVNGTRETDLWYCPSSVSGATTVTVTFSGAAGTFDKVANVWEVSGFTHTQLNAANGAFGTASNSPMTGAQVTTSAAGEFVVGEVYSQQGIQTNPASGNAFTSGGNIGVQGNGAGASLIASSASTYAPAWGYTSGSSAFAASTAAWVNIQSNVAPTITSAASMTLSIAAAGTFTVTATGVPTPTLSESGSLPAGVTFNVSTGVLSGTPAAGTAGSYPITFTAQNGVGANATQSFTLTVNSAPVITSQPSNQTVTLGQSATFSVVAAGNPPPSYQWLKNGGKIANATSSSYTTPTTTSADNGTTFSVVVSNVDSSITSNSATLIVVSLPSLSQVLAAIKKVNNYWIANNVPGDRNWTEATYFTGDLAAYDATGQSNYLTFAQTWATNNGYGICGTGCGEGTFDPDYQAAGEAYIRLYQLSNNASDLTAITQSVNSTVNSGEYNQWVIPDDMNMSAPSFVELGSIYNDTGYYTTMYALYIYTKNSVGLYDSTKNLWWENSGYVNTSTYWSRGNGWALAAHAKILSVLPTSDPHYAEYLSTYLAMAQAVAARQQTGGYWNSDLGGTDFAGPESSGTSFFLYGLAWGLNNGMLDRSTYLPVVENAWNFLANTATQPSGLLGYVQPIGSAPASTTATTTADFGVGAFLLAARQMALLTQ